MTTATTTTIAVPLTAAQLEVMLAEAKASEAEAAVQAQAPADPYFVSSEFTEIPSAEAKKLLKSWHDAKAEFDKAKEKMEAAKQAILERMDFAEVLVSEETGQYLCESRVSTALVLDSAKLKKAHPELIADFQRERRSRSFRVLV